MRIVTRMNIGGPSVQITGLMTGLNARQFQHRLIYGVCVEPEREYLPRLNDEIDSVEISTLKRSINPLDELRTLLRLIQEIRKFKPHIIHTHMSKAGVLGRLASIFSFQKSIRIHTYHGHLLHGYYSQAKLQVIMLVEKFLANFTHYLLAVGNNVRSDLLAVGLGSNSTFGIMPPGIKINNTYSRKAARSELGLRSDDFVCLFLGRLTKIKRPDRYLQVARLSKENNLPVKFLLVGDGELRSSCTEMVKKYSLDVDIIGWSNDVELFLSASDVIMLTSDNEGTPISLIQASMLKVPAIAVNVGSVNDVILDGVTGWLSPATPEKLFSALTEVFQHPYMRDEFGIAAQKYCKSTFSYDNFVRNHEELYKKLFRHQATY